MANIIDRALRQFGLIRIAVMEEALQHASDTSNDWRGDTADLASRLSGTAHEVTIDIGDLVNEVESQLAKIDSVAAAINQMSASIQEVAQNTIKASDTAAAAKREVKAGALESTNAMGTIDQLNDDISRASSVIERVKGESIQINSVLDVIRGIADQTNLLALNAAIEAARAGEQGRGFAVVADEVRTLATRTGDATKEIRTMIDSLNVSVEDAVNVMQAASEQAARSESSVEQTAMSLGEIAGQVNTINEMNTQVASATEEQSAVAEEINKNISIIAQLSEAAANNARQVATRGEKLLQQIAELSQTINR
jgi:methyl-accepting chemotaxis protein